MSIYNGTLKSFFLINNILFESYLLLIVVSQLSDLRSAAQTILWRRKPKLNTLKTLISSKLLIR